MPRLALGKSVFYEGAITTSQAAVGTASDLNIEELVLSNTTSTDGIVISFYTTSGTLQGTLVISANDQIVKSFGDSWWYFSGGLQISASDTGVRYQITGNQRP
jgi:hypothetical protein